MLLYQFYQFLWPDASPIFWLWSSRSMKCPFPRMLESWKAPLINFCLWGGIALEWVKEPGGVADRRLIETWIMDISGYLKEVLREDWMEWNIISRGLLIDYCLLPSISGSSVFNFMVSKHSLYCTCCILLPSFAASTWTTGSWNS